MQMLVGAQGNQKGTSDPWEPKLQAIVSLLMWFLPTNPRSSARAATTEPSLSSCMIAVKF